MFNDPLLPDSSDSPNPNGELSPLEEQPSNNDLDALLAPISPNGSEFHVPTSQPQVISSQNWIYGAESLAE